MGSFAWKWENHLRLADDLGIGGLGLIVYIKDDPESGAGHLLHKADGVGGGVDEVRLGGGKRLEADHHPALFGDADGWPERLRSPLPGLLVAHAIHHVALLGRANDHHLAAQIGTEMGERNEIVGGALTNSLVRGVDVKALRLDEHPVDASDLHPRGGRCLADTLALGSGDLLHALGKGEGGDLDGIIADARRVLQHVVDLPTLEHLVADSKLHSASISGRSRLLLK